MESRSQAHSNRHRRILSPDGLMLAPVSTTFREAHVCRNSATSADGGVAASGFLVR
jgi:hypothetical protein